MHLRYAIAGAAVVAAVVAGPATLALMQDSETPLPESGTAQVVAQGVVTIGDGDYRWVVSDVVATPLESIDETRPGLGFVVVNGGALLVEETRNGELIRLATGEAALIRPGDRQIWTPVGSGDATLRTLELVSASTSINTDTVVFESEPFAGSGARNDLDLVQDVMGPGGTLVIPAGQLPTLVSIDAGVADIATEAGDVLSLGAGEAASLAGALTITAGEPGATLSAALTGSAEVATAQAAATPTAAEGVIEIEQGESVATPAASPIAGATSVPVASPDDDGDELSNELEEAAGTDPALADTDEDGLTDGQEVDVHGTNPLVADSDGDGVLDGDEVAQGTNPNDATAGAALPVAEPAEDSAVVITGEPAPVEESAAVEAAPEVVATPGDSDGDGLEDAIEYELGTDPFDTDTDDDGLTDGDEYYVFATGTRNPDSDGDGVLDGDETAVGTDPNNPAG